MWGSSVPTCLLLGSCAGRRHIHVQRSDAACKKGGNNYCVLRSCAATHEKKKFLPFPQHCMGGPAGACIMLLLPLQPRLLTCVNTCHHPTLRVQTEQHEELPTLLLPSPTPPARTLRLMTDRSEEMMQPRTDLRRRSPVRGSRRGSTGAKVQGREAEGHSVRDMRVG